jgi:hypothetical protein
MIVRALRTQVRSGASRAEAWLFSLSCLAINASAQEKGPALRPPLGEIPPTFWELHGSSVIGSAIVAVLLIAIGLWLWLRPKPVVPLLPEIQARAALEAMANRPEDGAMLSRVPQILRHYVQTAFDLPTGEATTREFGQALAAHEQIGQELSSALMEFLRDCDRRKFARTDPSAPLGAVARALELVTMSEARRAHLRQLAKDEATQPAVASA